MATIPHIAFPVRFDGTRLVEVEQGSLDHVADQVAIALRTHPPEGTPMRPSWGTPSLLFAEQPIDFEGLAELVMDLVPDAEMHIDELDSLIERGLVRANVYVSQGG